MKTTVGSKRILAYGDSITWGRIPNRFTRYDENTRWTAVLQQRLGEAYEVIEEGLRGRFLAGENPFISNRDGLKQFGPILASQLPVDLLILFLGTNDTNSKANKTPQGIASGLNGYFELIDQWCDEFRSPKPKVLIIAPPIINDQNLKLNGMFEGATQKSSELPPLYEALAKAHGALFFDSSKLVSPGDTDGVHLESEAHKELGSVLAPIISSALTK